MDEVAVRRLTAPPEIVKKQLYHLAGAVNGDPRGGVAVLSVEARIESFTVPKISRGSREHEMSDGKYTIWRKSSYSANSGNCVEISTSERTVAVRDSKQDGRGPILEFSAGAWREFLTQAKKGTLDITS